MSEERKTEIPQLMELAELRYELRGFLSFSESASEQAGVAAQQYQLMQVIEAVPEGKQATITYIAERMILKHNSAVELVDRAERAGIVTRSQDDKDLRRSIVTLLPKGREVLVKLVPMHLEELKTRTQLIVDALYRLNPRPASEG